MRKAVGPGLPQYLVSDIGKKFVGKELKWLCIDSALKSWLAPTNHS